MHVESKKKIQIVCFIAIILFLMLFLKASYNQWPFTKMGSDFTAYWASAQLLINGENPYQSDQIFALETSVGWTDKMPMVMYNPPWVLTFILPFSLENYLLGKFLWLLFIFILHINLFDLAMAILWRYKRQLEFSCSLFIYMPLYFCLVNGQIVPLILLGVVGFLHFEKQKKWFLAGVFVCLLTIKPQDSYLFFIALLFWIIYKKRWGILLGAGCATFLITAIPLLYNPDIFFQYYTEILTHSFQYDWETPTLGYWLQIAIGKRKTLSSILANHCGNCMVILSLAS